MTNNRSGRGKSRRNANAGQAAGQNRGRSTGARPGQEKGRSTGQQGQRAGQRPQAGLSTALLNLPVQKNDETIIDIIGMNHDGEGVGRAEGYTLFVQGALPGERVKVRVLKTKKQYGYAKLLDIVQASPDRVAAPCPIYDQCGGCQLQHMSYEGQLAWKRQHVVDVLERIGKFEVASVEGAEADVVDADKAASTGIKVHQTLGMSEPWRYRNKAQVPIGVAEGGLVGGFYARGSHRIIDMETCLIQHEHNDEVVGKVKELGREFGISAYNEETGRGLLRHVVVKKAFRTGEMMLVLVTNGRDIPHKDAWIGSIREAIPHVASICQNVNTKQTNVIFGDETRVLWGRDVIYDYIGDVQFAISARSFYQVNPVQTEVLYGKTVEYAKLTGKETVIDAYCGIGTISLFLAQHADQVYGVEIVKEAIEDARSNAKLNEMNNVKFEVGASEDVIPRWKEQGIEADVIVVDPPRKGCDPRLLDTILEMKPERVVYVSCNPSTLARDLRVLEDGGYQTVEVQPVDMFPHTTHVESVVLLVQESL
ncbi:23S rRNA (uracil(1939)-C(5))-methyltransferase RlmD [Paenibacillus sp. JX-17]|uniref:23S rRNA (Uracil(1939)-C(5))-methyltransferase RlmD n=1 Tax=Paenibacillus lacisoli TaxID=3064525 RepID=A0ABT9CE56_9BACL|nr:23S rRNA (uracil(1939)-C(5))-methyltransferase RlmD [Paenibacillus sp. JX-17]MDO7907563.1 23S rRNA (uracil(1939)-C(5))-methyltransferase RlmD [Paenibacillus sp. JX-17]